MTVEIRRFSPRFARHWTHVIFHAGLSDDYDVAMTNFAWGRASPNHDRHPHDNWNKSNYAAERTFYKQYTIKNTHTYTRIHINCYTRRDITYAHT